MNKDKSHLSLPFERAAVGAIVGLLAGFVLAFGSHSLLIALPIGLLVGVVYSLVTAPSAERSLERIVTAAALGFPLWAVLDTVLLPVLAGQGPQWSAEGMQASLPGLISWIAFGAVLGALLPLANSAVAARFGPAPDHLSAADTPPATKRIVILGGGFAGITAAEELERLFGSDLDVQLTLISDSNALLFTPMLAEVAGSSLEPSHISSPLRTSLRRTQVIRAKVTSVAFDKGAIFTDLGDPHNSSPIPYDHLVFALGAKSNYFGNENIRRHSFDFKGLLDAIRIRNHVIEMFERADAETDVEMRKELLTFVIAGGGFAGVELAGALNDFARGILADYPHLHPTDVQVVVVHPRDTILPELSPSLGNYARVQMERRGVYFVLGSKVLDATPNLVKLNDREFRSRTLVWTAGTVPNPVIRDSGVETDKNGAVFVENTFAVKGQPNIWALGDCAVVIDAKTNQRCPPTAQFALRQGRVLARNIHASVHGVALRPFHFDSLGALCVVGHHTACAELNLPFGIGKSVRFSGLFAWILWRGIYVSKLPGLERKVRVLLDWTVELFFPRDIVQTIDLQ